MLNFLPAPLIGIVSFLLLVLNTLFCSTILLGITLLKLAIPNYRWRFRCSQLLTWIARAWVDCNNFIFLLTQKMEWDVQGAEGLRHDGWYLIISNHRSWVDIPVLQKVFNRKIPFLKFFLKKELIWVPLLGIAWWALDFPFMKRYSKETLSKKPQLRGKDMETTRRACEKFRLIPVSIINFLEGTRYTHRKRQQRHSPYRHLLPAKAGGIAFALCAMGACFTEILNVTIVYPVRQVRLWDLLCGKLNRIIVRVERIPVPQEALAKDYETDAEFRTRFQAWVNQLWLQKDALIEQLLPPHAGDEASV